MLNKHTHICISIYIYIYIVCLEREREKIVLYKLKDRRQIVAFYGSLRNEILSLFKNHPQRQ